MWTVGHNQLGDQVQVLFEDVPGLAEALARLVTLKQDESGAHVWARGPFYDIQARLTDVSEVGFVVRPTVEADHDLPATCVPFTTAELLKLDATDEAIVAAERGVPDLQRASTGTLCESRRERESWFLCSTCGHWTETLPKVARPGRRARGSDLAE